VLQQKTKELLSPKGEVGGGEKIPQFYVSTDVHYLKG